MPSHENRRRVCFELLECRIALSGYYVSPVGDDAAAGTIDAPWKTLPHAVAAAAPGDVINLRAGSYAGGVYVSDPAVGAKRYYDWGTFSSMWSVLDGMALAVSPM